jgi:hypothetical protein
MSGQMRCEVQGREAVGAISCLHQQCVRALPGAHSSDRCSCFDASVVEVQDTASVKTVDDKRLSGEYTVRGGTLLFLPFSNTSTRSKHREAPFAARLYTLQ